MRPRRTHLAVLRERLALEGTTVVDVGCGDGTVTRRLACAGAQVIGVDPSRAAIARARAHAGPGERYVTAAAQELPLPDGSADAVTFLNSLHHVPSMALGQALREACRVLRRGGVVYVQEPLAEGGYYELVRLVDDEAGVRAAAQRVLAEPQRAGLRAAGELEYDAPVRHRDFAAFRDRLLLADARRTAAFARRASELEERFRTEGDSGPDGWCFQAPTRVTLLRRALD